MITYKRTDMFKEEGWDIMVNTVNCVGVMGKGIALEVKKRYPAVYKQYVKDCQQGLVEPGHIKEYTTDMGKTIINFSTKDHWRSPSQYNWIKSGLIDLRVYLEGIHFSRKVLIPALGCGNGFLKWAEVKILINKHLEDLEHEILVFEPY